MTHQLVGFRTVEISNLCSTALNCAHEFQGLISGSFAIIAALFTAYIIFKSANLPIDEEKRRLTGQENRLLNYYYRKLSDELLFVRNRSRQAKGTIQVVIASAKDISDKTRERVFLEIPEEFGRPEIMSIFPADMAKKCMNLQRLLRDHNFDMMRAGGSFGADDFQQSLFQRLDSIAGRSGSLSSELECQSKSFLLTD